MEAPVLSQVGTPGETLAAAVTSVGVLPGVHVPVLLQIGELCEGLGAVPTLVRLFPGM